MTDSDLEPIGSALGHPLDEKRKEAVHDLYDLPPDILQDAKKLGSMTLSYQLLRFYTASEVWPWLTRFIDDVVQSGSDLRTWRRGGFLFPNLALDTLVEHDVGTILSVLNLSLIHISEPTRPY